MFQDFKLAIRSLSHNPMFSLGAIATLALGIGVNSTIFTLANAALFKAMPGVASPDELVWISGVSRERPRPGGMSYPEYLDYREASRESFSNLLAFGPTSFSLGSGGEPERIRGHLVTGSYFETLGALPAAGRVLQPTDDRPGAEPAAVLGYRLWRQRFGGAMDVIGTPIVVNGRPFTVVGVAADGFSGPELGQGADFWLPIAGLPGINTTQAGWLDERGTLWLRVIGRLAPGKTAQQAGAAVTGIAAALERTYPETNKGRTTMVSQASSGLSPGERAEILPFTALLLGVTGLVLIIACANVANLLLARGAGRSLEMTIRVAVGASRGRLVRQLLTESLVLAGGGAAAGLLVLVLGLGSAAGTASRVGLPRTARGHGPASAGLHRVSGGAERGRVRPASGPGRHPFGAAATPARDRVGRRRPLASPGNLCRRPVVAVARAASRRRVEPPRPAESARP